MGIKRYTANADSTITNAYKPNSTSQAIKANMGAADSLEVYSLNGEYTSDSHEASRILVKFPIDSIITDRAASDIEDSGSVSFWLKLSNVEHPMTLPVNFNLVIQPLSASWSEGIGLDLDEYSDVDAVNWISASENVLWSTDGGDVLETPNYTCSFTTGLEDIEVDISDLVEQWIDGTITNYGLLIKMPEEIESGSVSYFTKRFSGRTSEYFFKRPVIEARWNSSRKDMRSNFFPSASSYSAAENLNSVYYYHRNRAGSLSNVGGTTASLYVNIFTTDWEQLTPTPESPITATWIDTGIYKAEYALDTTESVFYDVWSDASSNVLYTGSVRLYESVWDNSYVMSCPNLQAAYTRSEAPRIRCFTRRKKWYPERYVTVNSDIEPDIIDSLYYSIIRAGDDLEVIPFLTSSEGTQCSYDISGSYFDFDMSLLEEDYAYYLKFAHYVDGSMRELKGRFKFRVEEA